MKVSHLCAALCGFCLFAPIDAALAQSAPTSVATQRTKDPYKFTGLLSFLSDGGEYIGSAAVVKPYSVLTAGHNLYSEGTGWSTDVIFERAYDYGESASRSSASKLYILGGYSSLVDRGRGETDSGFSRDMGGITFYTRPAKGFYAEWRKNTALLTGSYYHMSLGYGADVHSGEELLRSSSTRGFHQISGAYYENKYYGIEGGMSGGPVYVKSGSSWFVCAVNVSGPAGNVYNRGAGVRAIDADASALINNSLK